MPTFFRSLGAYFLISALLLIVLLGNGALDWHLAQIFFHHDTQSFLFQHNPVVDLFFYTGLKNALWGVLVVLIIISIYLLKKHPQTFTLKHMALGLIGTFFIIASVYFLKKLTGIECPWSIQHLGGHLPYVPPFIHILDMIQSHRLLGEGRCFPAGHPTGGLYLWAWAAAFYDTSPRAAKALAFIGLLLGLVMGLTRMSQGAHFFSHVLWSVWLSGFIVFILSKLFLPRLLRQ